MLSDHSGPMDLPPPDAPRPFQAFVKSRARSNEGEQVALSVFEVVQINIDVTLAMITFQFANGNNYHYPIEQYEQIWLRSGDAPTDNGD